MLNGGTELDRDGGATAKGKTMHGSRRISLKTTGLALGWLLALGVPATACSAGDPAEVESVDDVPQGIRCGANGAGDTCQPSCPCPSGGGDCDSDSDCAAGLICSADIGAKFGMREKIDVCVPSHCVNGVSDPGQGETGVDCGGSCGECVGGPSCPPNGRGDTCSAQCPCASGWGDCEPGECMPGLVCTDDVGIKFGMMPLMDVCLPPHCSIGTQDGDETGVDSGGACGACPANGNGDTCSPGCPCPSGWGDCDSDANREAPA